MNLFLIKKLMVSYFKVFGFKCFILNIKENLGKFDKKTEEGIFLGYSSDKKAYRVYNKYFLIIEVAIHVSFDESFKFISKNDCDEEDIQEGIKKLNINDEKGKTIVQEQITHSFNDYREENEDQVNDLPRAQKYNRDHPKKFIIGETS